MEFYKLTYDVNLDYYYFKKFFNVSKKNGLNWALVMILFGTFLLAYENICGFSIWNLFTIFNALASNALYTSVLGRFTLWPMLRKLF